MADSQRPRTEAETSGGLFRQGDPLWQLIGAFGDDRDEVDDVSRDKYRYLAEAYGDLHEDR
jgi:hypothetical protein